MANDFDPVPGQWYRHLDRGQPFQVIDVIENGALVEVQHYDGDIEAMERAEWRGLAIETAEPPEDVTGPLDDVETDDLDYSETAMSEEDWLEPVGGTAGDAQASDGDEGSEEDEEVDDYGLARREVLDAGFDEDQGEWSGERAPDTLLEGEEEDTEGT